MLQENTGASPTRGRRRIAPSVGIPVPSKTTASKPDVRSSVPIAASVIDADMA